MRSVELKSGAIFVLALFVIVQSEVRVTLWKNPECLGRGESIAFEAPDVGIDPVCVPFNDSTSNLDMLDRNETHYVLASNCSLDEHFSFNVSQDANCTVIEHQFEVGLPNSCNVISDPLNQTKNASAAVSCEGISYDFHSWIELELCASWPHSVPETFGDLRQSTASSQDIEERKNLESSSAASTCGCHNKLKRTKTWKDEHGCQRVWETHQGVGVEDAQYVFVAIDESCPTTKGTIYPITFFADENCSTRVGLPIQASAHSCISAGSDNVIMYCSTNVTKEPIGTPPEMILSPHEITLPPQEPVSSPHPSFFSPQGDTSSPSVTQEPSSEGQQPTSNFEPQVFAPSDEPQNFIPQTSPTAVAQPSINAPLGDGSHLIPSCSIFIILLSIVFIFLFQS